MRYLVFIVRRIFSYKGPAGLVNLAPGLDRPRILPELIGDEVTVENVVTEVQKFFSDIAYRGRVEKELEQLRVKMIENIG